MSGPTFTLADARAAHPLWFSRGAMRGFGTRIGKAFYAGPVLYLVTSEQPPYGPRTYNVRRFTAAHVDTIGPNIDTGHGSRARAEHVAAELAELERGGALREREDRDTFEPCRACTDAGEPFARWAGLELVGATGRVPLCDVHVTGALEPAGEGRRSS